MTRTVKRARDEGENPENYNSVRRRARRRTSLRLCQTFGFEKGIFSCLAPLVASRRFHEDGIAFSKSSRVFSFSLARAAVAHFGVQY